MWENKSDVNIWTWKTAWCSTIPIEFNCINTEQFICQDYFLVKHSVWSSSGQSLVLSAPVFHRHLQTCLVTVLLTLISLLLTRLYYQLWFINEIMHYSRKWKHASVFAAWLWSGLNCLLRTAYLSIMGRAISLVWRKVILLPSSHPPALHDGPAGSLLFYGCSVSSSVTVGWIGCQWAGDRCSSVDCLLLCIRHTHPRTHTQSHVTHMQSHSCAGFCARL